MNDNKLGNTVQRIPDVIKGWLGLAVAIAACSVSEAVRQIREQN